MALLISDSRFCERASSWMERSTGRAKGLKRVTINHSKPTDTKRILTLIEKAMQNQEPQKSQPAQQTGPLPQIFNVGGRLPDGTYWDGYYDPNARPVTRAPGNSKSLPHPDQKASHPMTKSNNSDRFVLRDPNALRVQDPETCEWVSIAELKQRKAAAGVPGELRDQSTRD